MREGARQRGDDPNELPRRYAKLINAAIADRPAGMTVCTHLCRGNFKSAWVAEGGYEPVAEVLFNDLAVDGYFLEYDDERSGDFSPLRFVPKGKIVVLGLVTTKVGELESKDDIKRRIDEAARYVPLEQLCLVAAVRVLEHRARQRDRAGLAGGEAAAGGGDRAGGVGRELNGAVSLTRRGAPPSPGGRGPDYFGAGSYRSGLNSITTPQSGVSLMFFTTWITGGLKEGRSGTVSTTNGAAPSSNCCRRVLFN